MFKDSHREHSAEHLGAIAIPVLDAIVGGARHKSVSNRAGAFRCMDH
jgi:hypothetical protein